MTRFLSEALQAAEPSFRAALQHLERANGHPNTDIRFSVAVNQATKNKIHELGLDPNDVTAEELYLALQARVKADDARLVRSLRTAAATNVSAEAQLVDGMIYALKSLSGSKQSFALKASVVKSLLKKQAPKKAMKQLGYRSIDSFLKHEQPLFALTAAWLSEGQVWQRHFVDQYKKLQPKDFEVRRLQIVKPTGARWHKFSQSIVSSERHNLVAFRELAALVILPFTDDAPAGAATVSLMMALHELNEIGASSTFLKLSQVRPDFGSLVQKVISEQPAVSSQQLDIPVPWHIIQRYYAKLAEQAGSLMSAIFEPHIDLADMAWHNVEQAISEIDPTLAFWHNTQHLGLLHNHSVVSMNLLDVALSYCNGLPFDKRVIQHFQTALRHDLLLSYLQHETVEHTVLAQLQPQLAKEPALA